MLFQRLYNLASGPLVWIALLTFALGTLFQYARFLRLSIRKEKPGWAVPETAIRLNEKGGASFRKSVLSLLFRSDWFTASPVMACLSTVFHVLLFVVPVFLLGHSIMIRNAIGIGFPALPEKISDGLTAVIIACGIFFLGRRLFYGRVRALSSFYDYFVLCLAAMPFITGFMAYHQFAHYKIVLTLHMLSGELLLMLIPYTKLLHMFFFFINRFALGGEHSFGKGKWTW